MAKRVVTPAWGGDPESVRRQWWVLPWEFEKFGFRDVVDGADGPFELVFAVILAPVLAPLITYVFWPIMVTATNLTLTALALVLRWTHLTRWTLSWRDRKGKRRTEKVRGWQASQQRMVAIRSELGRAAARAAAVTAGPGGPAAPVAGGYEVS